jgi:hypothetical protein
MTDNINGCVGRRRQATQERRICASSHEDEVGTYAPRARRHREDGPIYTRPARIALQRASALKNAIGWHCGARGFLSGVITSPPLYVRGPHSAGDASYAPDVLQLHRAATSGAHPASTIVRSCDLRP